MPGRNWIVIESGYRLAGWGLHWTGALIKDRQLSEK